MTGRSHPPSEGAAETPQAPSAGLTDAEVAARLALSRRTVSTHFQSVCGKLGVNTRSAATRLAVERGLV